MADNKSNNSKEENFDQDEPITLEFDDGTVMESEVLGTFEVDGKEYIALIPDDDSDDVYLFGYVDVNDDEYEILDIEDEEEFERVVKVFDALMEAGEDEEE